MNRLRIFIIALIFLGCGFKHKNGEYTRKPDTVNSNNDDLNQTSQKEYKIFPIDESGSDSSLVTFLNNLKKVVSQKDTAALFKSLDNSIVVSYGGEINGIKEFSKNWNLDQPGKSELWGILSQLLSMGGTWENDEDNYFYIPYTKSNKAFSKFQYDFDWYFTAVCISSNTIVYPKPETTSPQSATLNFDIVEIDPEFMNDDFTKISTIDRKVKGYVKTSELLHSASPRLIVKKIGQNWKVTAFAPFD